MGRKRLLGITVLGDFIINEGVEAVLANIVDRAGVNAVALNPTVTTLSKPGLGTFQPPSDAGSSPRLFDRPLWNQYSMWVRSAPSYFPCKSIYTDSPYKSRQPNELTSKYGHLIERFINEALDRGLKVYHQLSAVTPPNLLDSDRPRKPDGQIPDRMADTGCLASEGIRAYNEAYVRDLLEKYPQITGFRPDWPEYPCYKLEEAFQDFNPQVEDWAQKHHFNYKSIHEEVQGAYNYLHGYLTNQDLIDLGSSSRGGMTLAHIFRSFPGILEWLRLKTALSLDLLQHWRSLVTTYGGPEKEVSANAFMTPLTLWTGFDYKQGAALCDAISPKLYTMHWSVMVEFWGRTLMAWNPKLDEQLLVRALVNIFDLSENTTAKSIDDYGYPGPQISHPIPNEVQLRRIERVMAEVGGKALVTPLMHGYGPIHDFARRFRVVAESTADGIWINRYGYLSNAKLDAVGRIWRMSSSGGNYDSS